MAKKAFLKLALTNYQRATYLKSRLASIPNIKVLGDAPIFNEFAVNFNRPVENVLQHFRKHGIEPGLDLGKYYPELKGNLLVAVTETKSKPQLDNIAK